MKFKKGDVDTRVLLELTRAGLIVAAIYIIYKVIVSKFGG